jgi:hippurate hydrolase
VTVNDPTWTARLADAFTGRFGADRAREMPNAASGSEDFGSFGIEWGVPSVFWFTGGTDPELYAKAAKAGTVAQDIPTNHSPNYAPVIHPTLEVGIQAMVTAARRGLVGDKG